jgi:hypothetical protein
MTATALVALAVLTWIPAGCTSGSKHQVGQGPANTHTSAIAQSNPPGNGSCGPGAASSGVRAFIAAWNRHDAARMRLVLSPSVLLDMSTKSQRSTLPSINGGHESRQGRAIVLHFIRQQWKLGERLVYKRIQPFRGGAWATQLVAVYKDGSVQRMAEAKFAFDCTTHSLTHVVISASQVAALHQ